jgi:hypothetical protein
VLDLLAPAPTPTALRALSGAAIADLLAPHSPRLAKTLPAKILLALDAQTVLVPGTAEFGRVIAGVAAQLRDVRSERANLAADLEARPEAHPLAEVLTSMPGVGFRTTIKTLTIVGDGSAFPTAGHRAAYAVNRRSSTRCRLDQASDAQAGQAPERSQQIWSLRRPVSVSLGYRWRTVDKMRPGSSSTGRN